MRAVFALLFVLSACDPTPTECAFHCRQDRTCPGGLSCGADGYCHRDANAPACTTMSDGGADGGLCVGCVQGTYNYVFVTSTTHAPGQLGSVAAADRICADLAQSAGLPGTYLAWLSTPTQGAADRIIGRGARGFIRPDGRPFTDSIDKLTQADQIYYPLVLDERGRDVSGGGFPTYVATGTGKSGGVATDQTCGNWNQGTGTSYAAGEASATAIYWTASTPRDCAEAAHLYCFGVDAGAPIILPQVQGRSAFLTKNSFMPGSGRAAADAFCQQEATTYSLPSPERFLAFLPLESETASARFSASDLPWVRRDGIVWVARSSDLAAGKLLSALGVDPQGSYAAVPHVWTGAIDPNANGSSNCTDWIDKNGSVIMGRGDVIDSRAFDDVWNNTATCGDSAHLYCLQN